mgnify:CR=1 FL=1
MAASEDIDQPAGVGTLRKLWGMARRYYLTHFRQEYVESQKEIRQGECGRCGTCCKIVFDCPYLEEDNECTVYEERALQCRAFPIDERDLEEVPECEFRFPSDDGSDA